MSPEILTVATGVALLALILSALILCLVMTRALFKLYPDICRIVANLESTTASTAKVTENIAGASSLLGPDGTVANLLKTGKDLLTDELKQDLVNGIKDKIGDFLRQRRGR